MWRVSPRMNVVGRERDRRQSPRAVRTSCFTRQTNSASPMVAWCDDIRSEIKPVPAPTRVQGTIGPPPRGHALPSGSGLFQSIAPTRFSSPTESSTINNTFPPVAHTAHRGLNEGVLEKNPYTYHAGSVGGVRARARENVDPDVLEANGGAGAFNFPLYYGEFAENGNYLETNEINKRATPCGDPIWVRVSTISTGRQIKRYNAAVRCRQAYLIRSVEQCSVFLYVPHNPRFSCYMRHRKQIPTMPRRWLKRQPVSCDIIIGQIHIICGRLENEINRTLHFVHSIFCSDLFIAILAFQQHVRVCLVCALLMSSTFVRSHCSNLNGTSTVALLFQGRVRYTTPNSEWNVLHTLESGQEIEIEVVIRYHHKVRDNNTFIRSSMYKQAHLSATVGEHNNTEINYNKHKIPTRG